MRVLHVLNTGKYSGAENVVITLIHALEGHVDCAYASPDGPIREILKTEGIKFFPISSSAVNAKELKKIIFDYKPDIIHTHDYNAGIMACFTGTRLPIISHLHNNTPWLRKFCVKSAVYFASCMRYAKILTVSSSVLNEFVFGKFVRKKSQVIGNPINIPSILHKADEAGILCAQSDVIFLGRLSEQKNPFFFLDIVALLVKDFPDLKVAMVGAGELREQIECAISRLNLENNIMLCGFQKNPYGMLRSSKIMCMPSKWEGFGLAAVEGMAFGLPVVASPVGGLQEIVNESCGKLCSSKEEYVAEIGKLLSDKAYYNCKSDGAKKRSEEYDNSVSYSRKIEKIYFEISSIK